MNENLWRKRIVLESSHLEAWLTRGRGLLALESFLGIEGVLAASLWCCGLYARGRRNALSPRLRRVTVTLPRLPPAFDGFRILHLSDLHIDCDHDLGPAIRRLVQGLEIDLGVFTGDYRFEIYGPAHTVHAEMEAIVKCLNARHGFVGILGNHDFGEEAAELERAGVRMLLNEAVEIRRGGASLWVAGVDDPHFYGTDDLPAALGGVPHGAAKIALVHTPELYDQAARLGVDLYLCGHTHGGQLCLPAIGPLLVNAACPRRMAYGLWRHRRMLGFTSAGIGSSCVPVRYNCPPEAVLLTLKTQEVRGQR